jgi:mono/diheme cytochrome c family protein
MIFWAFMFNSNDRFRPLQGQSAEWNRGAYLVEALGHCGECHTPRNQLQGMNTRLKFKGGSAEGWSAFNITRDKGTGIGSWTPEELGSYLSNGHALGRGTASGPMAEAVSLSLSHLTPTDITAMVTYLRTIPPERSQTLPDHLAVAASPIHSTGPSGNVSGKQIFEGVCVSCHTWKGSGALNSRAQLTGSRSVNDPSAINVTQVILNGSTIGSPTQGKVGSVMPAFGSTFSNNEIAAVANYVTARFGSPSHISEAEVSRLRVESSQNVMAVAP